MGPNKKYILPSNSKLLVTCLRNYEMDAASEIWHALRATGYEPDAEVHIIRHKIRELAGLVILCFKKNSRDAVRVIKQYFLKKPWIMKFAQKVVPLEFISQKIEEIEAFLEKNRNRIGKDDTWKINVNKHLALDNRKYLIDKLAKKIWWGKVNLSNPIWIVNLEIITNNYAISIIKKDEILKRADII